MEVDILEFVDSFLGDTYDGLDGNALFWRSELSFPSVSAEELATYDDLVFFCFQWKKHSQSESESRIHWLKSRRNHLNRRYLTFREASNLQDTMLKNHLVGRFKEMDSRMFLMCVSFFSKLECERDLRLARTIKRITEAKFLKETVENGGFLSELGAHIERETRGRVKFRHIKAKQTLHERCANAVAGSVKHLPKEMRGEELSIRVANVYQVENVVLKEEFRVQVDELCAERDMEMDKSLFKGLFLPVSHSDVSKVAVLGLNLKDDHILSSVLPVDMSVVLPEYINGLVMKNDAFEEIFSPESSIKEPYVLEKFSVDLSKYREPGHFFFFLCKVFLGNCCNTSSSDPEAGEALLRSNYDSVFNEYEQAFYIGRAGQCLPEFLIHIQLEPNDSSLSFPLDKDDGLVLRFESSLLPDFQLEDELILAESTSSQARSVKQHIQKSFADLWRSVVHTDRELEVPDATESMGLGPGSSSSSSVQLSSKMRNLPFNPQAIVEEKKNILSNVQHLFLQEERNLKSVVSSMSETVIRHAHQATESLEQLLERKRAELEDEKHRTQLVIQMCDL